MAFILENTYTLTGSHAFRLYILVALNSGRCSTMFIDIVVCLVDWTSICDSDLGENGDRGAGRGHGGGQQSGGRKKRDRVEHD